MGYASSNESRKAIMLDCRQPTARFDNLRGFGNLPSAIMAYNVALDSPVTVDT